MTETNDMEKLEAAGIKTPAHLHAYVDALGVDGALELFLAMGGSQLYLPKRSGEGSMAATAIGADNVNVLAAALGHGYIKIPLARQWIALVMRARGKTDNEIARTVRADVATVRRWLEGVSRPNPEQLSLSL